MPRKWMLGTALAASLATLPAMAQTADSPFGLCALDGMTEATFNQLDRDADGALGVEEYRACLDEASLALDDSQSAAFEAAFRDADGNADGSLVFAEIESVEADTAAADAASEAPQGTITVVQPAAEVTVSQPAPQVSVSQPEPKVAVVTKDPTVSVSTPEPDVRVTQAEPTVSVSQPEPQVAVTQPAPTVRVAQPEPQVSVDAGRPAVSVDAAPPEVAVSEAEPEVEVTQPELAVNVEQADPAVKVEQAAPEVAVTETQTQTQTADASAAAPAAGEPQGYTIRVEDWEGSNVVNAEGQEIGRIEEVVLDSATEEPAVVVAVGGFLGMGEKKIAFPYRDFAVAEKTIVLDTAMSEDDIKAMPDYDAAGYEALPETMIIQ
ncbi:PRC-barrel domain-containing protein [Acuticoccus kandeliae]|uniref:PRC-barrel domain-containing protein n=1 Tax=Acuticoccus kandeliae TaxID=2073160 RepID=UPI000D3EB87B|nr:PRC-barrel domain-containing protein [Acuticoccus kandeliae]